MAGKYLGRSDAPFGEKVWKHLDDAAIGAARAQLSVRRLIDIEGPYGLGTKSVPTTDVPTKHEIKMGDVTASASGPGIIPLAGINSIFQIGMRDIAAFEQIGAPFDTRAVAHAAIAVARMEDELLLNGSRELGTEGLLGLKGSISHSIKSWKTIGAAVDDIIAAVTKMDNAGIHGPYALGLAPSLYNLLLRRYEHGEMTEMDHVKRVVTEGVVKLPALDSGGVLIATGRIYASVVIGQDLMAGFIGPIEGAFEFSLSESVALRIKHPSAVCALAAAK